MVMVCHYRSCLFVGVLLVCVCRSIGSMMRRCSQKFVICVIHVPINDMTVPVFVRLDITIRELHVAAPVATRIDLDLDLRYNN